MRVGDVGGCECMHVCMRVCACACWKTWSCECVTCVCVCVCVCVLHSSSPILREIHMEAFHRAI